MICLLDIVSIKIITMTNINHYDDFKLLIILLVYYTHIGIKTVQNVYKIMLWSSQSVGTKPFSNMGQNGILNYCGNW